MKKTKRIMALLLCAIMSAGMMSGCVEKGSTDGEIKTVKIWSSVGHSKQFWNNKIQEFNETIGKEKGIKLEMEAQTDSGYAQKLEVAINSDDLPDLFDGGALKSLVELDRVVPIDDLPGCGELVKKYEKELESGANTYQGKTYSLISGATTRGLVYNKEMFKEAGLVDENGEAKPPVTFDEFREYAKILTDKSKNQYGVVFPLKWSSWVESDIITLAMGSFGIPNYDPLKKEYDYTILKPIIDTYLGMREDGSVYPGAEGLDNDPARARFAEGGIGMKIAYSFDVGVFTTQFPAKFDWGVAPLPVMDADNCYKQTAINSWGMRVSKKGIERHGEDVMGLVYSWWYGDENVRSLYEAGLEIPPVWDVVEDITLPDDMEQWKAFCEMKSISVGNPKMMPTDMTGKEKIADLVVNNIFGKGEDVLETLKKHTDDRNAGIAKYKEINPDIDYSVYDYSEWDIKR